MRKIMFLMLFSVMISLISCEEDPVDELPPITTTGENTFGCLVNGKAYTHTGGLLCCGFTSTVINNEIFVGGFNYQLGLVEIGIRDHVDSVSGVEYRLTNDFSRVGSYTKRPETGPNRKYYTDENLDKEGMVTFLKIDTVDYIISGTFEFDAINAEGKPYKSGKEGLIFKLLVALVEIRM